MAPVGSVIQRHGEDGSSSSSSQKEEEEKEESQATSSSSGQGRIPGIKPGHWTYMKEKAKDNPEHLAFLNMAHKTQEHFLDEKSFKPSLEHLNDRVKQHREGGTKKALTTALSEQEQAYGLGKNAPIYTRPLSGPEFADEGGKGHLFKDVGVTPQHGEYTHRIQWDMAMHHLSEGHTLDAEGVKKKHGLSPLEFFKGMQNSPVPLDKPDDDPETKDKNDVEGTFWDNIFDYTLYPQGEEGRKSVGAISPEALNGSLGGQVENSNAYPNGAYREPFAPDVSAAVKKRFAKRSANRDMSTYIARKTGDNKTGRYVKELPDGGVLRPTSEAERNLVTNVGSSELDNLGVSFPKNKTPSGISKMRNAASLNDMLKIGADQHAKTDLFRHKKVAALYKEAAKLRKSSQSN